MGDDADLVGEVIDEVGFRGGTGDGLAADAPRYLDGIACCRRVAVRPLAVALMGGANGGGGDIVASQGSVGDAAKDVETGIRRNFNAVLGTAGVDKVGNRGRTHQDALGNGEVELPGIGGAVGPFAVGGAR